jgi:hypothetical protein
MASLHTGIISATLISVVSYISFLEERKEVYLGDKAS